MKRTIAIAFVLGLLTVMPTGAEIEHQTQKITAGQVLPRDLEIELALSALPAHLRDEASIYVLGKSQKFEIVRQGSNGFHSFVSRNDPNASLGSWPHTEYQNDILIPIAFDDAGSRAHMRVLFDMAELRAAGTSAEDMKALMNGRYETEYYPAPDRAGISYMLSPVFRTYVNPEESDLIATMNVPHYMFYAPGVSNRDIGGKFQSEYPFVLSQSPSPHGYIIQIVGQAEKVAINREYEEMLARLCDLMEVYCLPG